MKELSDATFFGEPVKDAPLAAVLFSGERCPHCRTFRPVFSAAAGDRDRWAFFSVDTDRSPELVRRFSVRSIPTTVILKNGQEVARAHGAISRAELENLLDGAEG